jgi:hypothetical protein
MSERGTSRKMKPITLALFVSCIGIVALSANPGRAEPVNTESASKACLSSPGGTGPEGSHWYYRVDRANSRRCWYLAPRGERARQAVTSPAQPSPPSPSNSSSSSQPSQPSQPAVTRRENRSFGTRAENPIGNRSETSAGPAQEKTFTVPDGIVTSFSEAWPSLPQAGNALGRRLSPMRNSDAAEPSSVDQTSTVPDNMPLVRPVRTELIRPVHTETVGANVILSAANVIPSASDGAIQQMLPWLIVALGLAGVIVGLIYRLAAPRRRSHADRWDNAIGVARVRQDPIGGVGQRPAKTVRDPPDAALKPASAGRWVESARDAWERDDHSRREFEASLREIVDRRRRSAA